MEEFKMCSDGEFMPVSLPCPPPYSGPYYYYPYESIPFPPVDGYTDSSSSSRGGGAPISAGAVAGIIILVSFIFVMMCVFAVKCRSRSLIFGNIIRRPGADVPGNDDQEHIMNGGHDLQLLSIAGAAAGRGLEEKLVRLLPVFEYVGFLQEDAGKVKKDSSSTECAVCLSSFEDKEIVRLLPKCHHTFHVHCIDTWFQSHANCPLCRERITLQTIQLYFKGPDQLQPPAGTCNYPCDHPPPQSLYPYPSTHQQLPTSCDHSVHDQLRPAARLLIPPAGTLELCANPATVINEGHNQNDQQYAAKHQNENQPERPASDDDQHVNDEQSAAGLACGGSLAQGLHLHQQVLLPPAVSTADHHEIDVRPAEPCVEHMNDQLQDAGHGGGLHEEHLHDHQKVTAAPAAAGSTDQYEQESSADHDHSELLLLHATGESDHQMSGSCFKNSGKRSSSKKAYDDQQYYSSGEQKALYN